MKNHTGNSPPGTPSIPRRPGTAHRSSANDAVGQEVGEGDVEDPGDLVGGRPGGRPAAEGRPPPASSSVSEETVGIGVRWPDDGDQCRVEPDLLPGLPQGALVGGLPGSSRPPGKATSPLVGAKRARADGEQDPGLARLLEQGDQHGGRVGVRGVGRRSRTNSATSAAVVAASAEPSRAATASTTAARRHRAPPGGVEVGPGRRTARPVVRRDAG